jgi:hypothetical protein
VRQIVVDLEPDVAHPGAVADDYILVIRPPPGAVVSLREPSGALELGDAPLPLDRVTEHPQHLGEGAALLDRLPWRAVRLDGDRRPLRWAERLARYAPAGEAVTLSGPTTSPTRIRAPLRFFSAKRHGAGRPERVRRVARRLDDRAEPGRQVRPSCWRVTCSDAPRTGCARRTRRSGCSPTSRRSTVFHRLLGVAVVDLPIRTSRNARVVGRLALPRGPPDLCTLGAVVHTLGHTLLLSSSEAWRRELGEIFTGAIQLPVPSSRSSPNRALTHPERDVPQSA